MTGVPAGPVFDLRTVDEKSLPLTGQPLIYSWSMANLAGPWARHYYDTLKANADLLHLHQPNIRATEFTGIRTPDPFYGVVDLPITIWDISLQFGRRKETTHPRQLQLANIASMTYMGRDAVLGAEDLGIIIPAENHFVPLLIQHEYQVTARQWFSLNPEIQGTLVVTFYMTMTKPVPDVRRGYLRLRTMASVGWDDEAKNKFKLMSDSFEHSRRSALRVSVWYLRHPLVGGLPGTSD